MHWDGRYVCLWIMCRFRMKYALVFVTLLLPVLWPFTAIARLTITEKVWRVGVLFPSLG